MIPMTITTNLELDPWRDLVAELASSPTSHETAKVERIGVLPNGTTSGRATVSLLVRLPDGTPVLAETTLRLFTAAAAALAATPTAQMEDL